MFTMHSLNSQLLSTGHMLDEGYNIAGLIKSKPDPGISRDLIFFSSQLFFRMEQKYIKIFIYRYLFIYITISSIHVSIYKMIIINSYIE